MIRVALALGTVVVIACAACTSSITTGSGRVAGTPPASPASPLPESSGAVLPSSTGPAPVPPPDACSTADCRLVERYDLGAGFRVAVYGNTSANGGAGAAILELRRDGASTYWRVFDGETPSEFRCATAGPVRNCVAVDYVGAHGAKAYPIVLIDGGLWVGEPVGTDTPALHAGDLDGDGRIDAFGLQNDYVPDYATGSVQWQSWQRSADGLSFSSTGCGRLTATPAAGPAALLTGACQP